VAGKALQEGFIVAWHRRETWWVLVWVTVLGFLLGLGVAFLGVSTMSSVPLSPSGVPIGLPAHLGALVVLGLFLLLVGMPFVLGGIYGTIADAIREQPIGPITFWENGLRYFGSAWGLFLMVVVLGLGYLVVLGLLSVVLHFMGAFGTLVFVLASIAAGLTYAVWIMWAFGALFVGRESWRESLRFGWENMRHHFGTAVMVWLALVAIAVVLVLVDLLLVHTLGVLGSLVGAALEAWVSLFAAAAELSLYRVVHGVPSSVTSQLLT